MTKELLQQALYALVCVSKVDDDYDILAPNLSDAVTESIEALRAALREAIAQPVPPAYLVEPVSRYGSPEMQSLILSNLGAKP